MNGQRPENSAIRKVVKALGMSNIGSIGCGKGIADRRQDVWAGSCSLMKNTGGGDEEDRMDAR